MKIFVSGTLFEFDEATVKCRPGHLLEKLRKKHSEQKQVVSADSKEVDTSQTDRPFDDIRGLIRSPNAEMEATTAANTSAHITVHGRSTEAFKAIWTYYQTGRLHIPLCVCSGAFKEELDYWGISTSELADCCLYRYYAFKEDQKTRGDFLKESSASPRNAAKKESCYPRLRTVTGRIWNIVDNADGSLASRFYFGLVIAMVLLSIITMALSTDPSLRRKASSCEILEYMDYTDNKDTDKYREHLGNPSCKSYLIFLPFMAYSAQNEEKQEAGYDGTNGKFGVKPGTTDPVFNIPTTPSKDATESIPFESIAPTVDKPSTSDHPVNTQESQTPIFSPTRRTDVIPCFSSLCPTKLPYRTKVIPQFISGEDEIVMSDGTTVRVPNLTVPVMALDVLESIALLFFSCDLLLHLITCPSLTLFFFSVSNIVDAIALASNFAYGFIVHFYREYRYMETRWLEVLTYVQIFRSIRLFRLVKNVRTGKILLYSLRKNMGDFLFLALLLCVGIGLFASLFYFVETRETIESIPMAWYWSVITMTTIGYGDVSPSTCLGRVVASLCGITGVIMLAISLPMFVNNFVKLNKYASLNESIENETHATACSSPHVEEKV